MTLFPFFLHLWQVDVLEVDSRPAAAAAVARGSLGGEGAVGGAGDREEEEVRGQGHAPPRSIGLCEVRVVCAQLHCMFARVFFVELRVDKRAYPISSAILSTSWFIFALHFLVPQIIFCWCCPRR